ncbi:hypothetical protein BX666DRAFT_1849465 [Dichotomocladium elegans]|nr:hypothetical protein BX666DRAFT_1849465 [Dichotomocladium elegans]
MASETHLGNSFFDDDPFAAGQSLEEELLGKGYFMEPLGSSLAAELSGSSLAAELSSATNGPPAQPPIGGNNKLASLAMNRSVTDAVESPVLSPPWYGRSRRSSFSSTWSSLDAEDDDPFEMLKRQLEELNSAVWETKTLHKRLFNTLSSDGNMRTTQPPLELTITSVANLVELKSRDRERQTSYLRNVDGHIRKEIMWMDPDTIRELDSLFASIKSTLHDQTYSYENPLPAIRKLNMETSSMTESLEELKEIMYVSKRQVQELNSRLRSIAKTVHEVRKDIRRINKFLEEKDDDDAVILEKGEVEQRVKDIMWGLDDLDEKSSREIRQMQLFWEGDMTTFS